MSINNATPEEWNKSWIKGRKVGEFKEYNKGDPVEKPDHYNTGAIEAIEAIKASMHPQEFKGYLKGNCMKYLWRYEYKNKQIEDLRKCRWYLERLIEENV